MSASVTGARRLLILLTAALGLAVASPLAVAGQGAPSASDQLRAAASTPFTLDLSTKGDFVAQTNFVQCVGASMQMMLNMVRAHDDRTAATQLDLQNLARRLSGSRPDGRQRQGASIRGWTAGLNQLGAGPYRTTGATDIQSILRIAAEAMRETNRPVGLLVWRGRHAWVMAGFTATADPRYTDDFVITEVIVMDPLYPYGSKTWGPSPKPRESLTVEELGRQFVPRGSRTSLPGGGTGSSGTSGWSQGLAGKYVVALPFVVTAPRGMGSGLR
ncbi:MAG TPA: hypothetical protein VFX65_11130 [Candidatus Limnocylindrales bacterium]|nr:hypothetical protein [Candidatus Limnocylindrales bacterium]